MAPTRTRRTSLPSDTRRSPIKTRRSSLASARSTRGRPKQSITSKSTSTPKRRPPPLRHTFKTSILSDDEYESGQDSPDPLNIVPRTSPLKTPRTTTLTPPPTPSRHPQVEAKPEEVSREASLEPVSTYRPLARRSTVNGGPRGPAVQADNAVAGPSRRTPRMDKEERLRHSVAPTRAAGRPSRAMLSSSSAVSSRPAYELSSSSSEAGPSRPVKRQRAGGSSHAVTSSPHTITDSPARIHSAATLSAPMSDKGESPALLPSARLAPEQAIKNRPSRIRRAAGGGAEGIRDIEQMIVDWLNSYRNVSSTPPDSTIIHLTTLPLSYLDPPALLVPDCPSKSQAALSTPARDVTGTRNITPSPRTAERPLPNGVPEGRIRVPGWRVVRLGEDDEEDARLEMLAGSAKSPRKTRHAHLEEDDADEVYIARHRKHELLERSLWLREKEALKFERHKLRSRLESLKSMSLVTWRAILAPVLARPDTEQWTDGRAKVEALGIDWLKDELVRSATKDLQRYDELLPNDTKKRKDPRDGLFRTATPPVTRFADETEEEESSTDFTAPVRKPLQRQAPRGTQGESTHIRERSAGPSRSLQTRRADKGSSSNLRPTRSIRSEINIVAASDDNDSLTPDAPTTRSSRTLLTPSSAAIFLSPAGSSPLTPLTDPKVALQASPLSPDQRDGAIIFSLQPRSRKVLLPAPPPRDSSPTRSSELPKPIRPAVVGASDRGTKIWARQRNGIIPSSVPLDPAKAVRDMMPSRTFHDKRQSKDMAKHALTPVMITRAEAREMKEVEAAVVI